MMTEEQLRVDRIKRALQDAVFQALNAMPYTEMWLVVNLSSDRWKKENPKQEQE